MKTQSNLEPTEFEMRIYTTIQNKKVVIALNRSPCIRREWLHRSIFGAVLMNKFDRGSCNVIFKISKGQS